MLFWNQASRGSIICLRTTRIQLTGNSSTICAMFLAENISLVKGGMLYLKMWVIIMHSFQSNYRNVEKPADTFSRMLKYFGMFPYLSYLVSFPLQVWDLWQNSPCKFIYISCAQYVVIMQWMSHYEAFHGKASLRRK